MWVLGDGSDSVSELGGIGHTSFWWGGKHEEMDFEDKFLGCKDKIWKCFKFCMHLPAEEIEVPQEGFRFL